MWTSRVLALIALVVMAALVGNAHAGLFSRAKTEGERLDEGGPVTVEGLFVYSFLLDGTDNNRRLAKDLKKYPARVGQAFREKGVLVESQELPAGTLQLDTGSKRGAGHVRELGDVPRDAASEVAREHRDQEAALPAGYRLLLVPQRVAWSAGGQWGARTIRSGSGSWAQRGAVGGAVPHYSYTVLWLLEDVNDRPIAAGTTTATLDIPGFPAEAMVNQMIDELERLSIRWAGAMDVP